MIIDPGQPNHNLTSDKSPLPVFIPLPVCRLSLDHYWLSSNQFFFAKRSEPTMVGLDSEALRVAPNALCK